MKRTTLAASIALAALFSASTQASIVEYNLSDSDGQADSFSVTFQYDNVANTIIGGVSGAVIDGGGVNSYTGVDILVVAFREAVPGVNEYIFSNASSTASLAFLLTDSASPVPIEVFGPYAESASATDVVDYLTEPTLITVPEPSILATLFAGLMGFAAAARGTKRQS